MSSTTYSFKWNRPTLNLLQSNVLQRMKGLAFKTSNEAKKGAPVLSSALQNSIRVVDFDKNTEIVAAGDEMDGSKVNYARFREHNNNAHPEKKYYMRNAFQWLKENYKDEFRGII